MLYQQNWMERKRQKWKEMREGSWISGILQGTTKTQQKEQMAVWGGLANSCEKKRSEKQKEKERYTHLNAEFQRIARCDKKAFLSNQYKEIEENNRIRKIRDLSKKTRDTKGTFHAKMGSIKDRNGRDLTEAEDIKKRWQEHRKTIQKRSSWPR